MKVSHWLSDTFHRRSRREQFVVVAGLVVIVMAATAVNVVSPLVRRWTAREEEIALRTDQLGRLRTLVAEEDVLRDAVAGLRAVAARNRRILLEGETPAVASSGLLQLLNRYAAQSQVVVERVDFAATATESQNDGIRPVPAYVTGRGDIYGLVDFLFYLQHGEKLLVIDEISVDSGRGALGDSADLTWTIGLHGHHALEGAP